jgi:hypothetical protein
MNNILEDMGNAVKIFDQIIPAVNIQIEGFPQFVDNHWYGIYFEIVWESDCSFEIHQYHSDAPIMLITLVRHADGTQEPTSYTNEFSTWVEFLRWYNIRRDVENEWRANGDLTVFMEV